MTFDNHYCLKKIIPPDNVKNMLKKKLVYFTVLSLIIIILSYSVLYIFKGDKIQFWVKEDGFFEYATSIWFLLASILFIILYIRSHTGNNFFILKTKKNVFFLLLGLLFFFGSGEEISWGQRLLNIETPEKLKEINAQGEITLHNLYFFSNKDEFGNPKKGITNWTRVDRLFVLFWIAYCIFVPILNKSYIKISNFLKTLNLPIVPLGLGFMFLADYFLSRIIGFTSNSIETHSIVEIKESNNGFIFFMISIYFIYTFLYHSDQLDLNKTES